MGMSSREVKRPGASGLSSDKLFSLIWLISPRAIHFVSKRGLPGMARSVGGPVQIRPLLHEGLPGFFVSDRFGLIFHPDPADPA